MLLRTRRTPSGFIEPCLPSPANHPPSGPGWIHEITHDGFRLMARRGAADVRLLSRNGHDWSLRYSLIVEPVAAVRVRSCLIDERTVIGHRHLPFPQSSSFFRLPLHGRCITLEIACGSTPWYFRERYSPRLNRLRPSI